MNTAISKKNVTIEIVVPETLTRTYDGLLFARAVKNDCLILSSEVIDSLDGELPKKQSTKFDPYGGLWRMPCSPRGPRSPIF